MLVFVSEAEIDSVERRIELRARGRPARAEP